MADSSSSAGGGHPPEINTDVPQTARIWNYWLGGKDNFPVDRQVGDQILEAFPAIVENARAYHLRSPDRIARFFDGLELVEPGVVSPPRWRPEPSASGLPAEIDSFCGVARKPWRLRAVGSAQVVVSLTRSE